MDGETYPTGMVSLRSRSLRYVNPVVSILILSYIT